jgi:hypothetical protein
MILTGSFCKVQESSVAPVNAYVLEEALFAETFIHVHLAMSK